MKKETKNTEPGNDDFLRKELGMDQFHYVTSTGRYVVPDGKGRLTAYSASTCRLTLISRLGELSLPPSEARSLAEGLMGHIVINHPVDLSGSLPGHRPGVVKVGGGLEMLVTEGPELPEPKAGDFSTIAATIEGTLGTKQTTIFYAHIAEAIRSYTHSQWQQSQAVVLAGPVNSKKSLIINQIYVPMLGGRAANGYPFFIGNSEFNGEFQRAEVLVVDDDIYRSENAARVRFGAQVKKVTTGGYNFPIHAKGREPFNVKAFWRVIVALNDDAKCLRVLPSFEESNSDKYLLFETQAGDPPMPANSPEEKSALRKQLRAEYPAFAHFLLNDFAPPPELVGGRTGVRPYLNPNILAKIREFDMDAPVLNIVEQNWDALSMGGNAETAQYAKAISTKPQSWTGTASELIRQIKLCDSDGGRALERINKSGNEVGLSLASLCKKYPENFRSATKAGGTNKFEIKLPID